MGGIRRLIKHPEFLLLIFCIGLVFFNWPFLGLFSLQALEEIFGYLFVIWALFIVVLLIVCIGYLRSGTGR